MRKKFGGYSIDARKYRKILRTDGLTQTTTILEGNIEIGIEIDPNTWRGDWLRDFLFGKDSWQEWRLINVENYVSRASLWIDGHEELVDRNIVTAVWAKKDQYGFYYFN